MITFFDLERRGTTVAREARGGATTFLTMSYILFANPAILAAAGVPAESVAAGTAAAAAICTLAMGLLANFPLALAPGMGLNAVVAFQVARETGSWQTAMGLVVFDGLVVLAFSLVGARESVMRAIPVDLRRAISVGIGLFIAFIGAINARVVVVPSETVAVLSGNPSAVLPPVTHGNLHVAEPLIALGGLFVIAFLLHRRVPGAIVAGILVAAGAALAAGVATLPTSGWVRAPSFEGLFQADLRQAFDLRFVPLLLSIVMVDFFDTIGTVTAIAETGGIERSDGTVPGLRRILAVDAASASVGGLFGVSSVTSYIESAAGVAEGARTGLHSVFVAGLFGLSMFLAPLAAVVPAAATAPALIMVGFLMCRQIRQIDFLAIETAVPAFLILLLVPLTYSVSSGIGFGFIAYVVIKLLSRRASDVHPLMFAAAAAFVVYFAVR